jgi:hypothetical protein
MACGGQTSRGQFQIGKASLRSRRPSRRFRAQSRGGEVLLLSPRTHTLSRLFPSSNVTSYSTLATSRRISNRNTPETGIAVTYSKQTTVVLSNRNKKTPPGGVLLYKQIAPYRPAPPGGVTGFGGASRAGLMAISMAVFFGKTTSCPRAMKCV